ncbi:hypothetical protein [Roseomonas sp. USHLN139]|uniref:hypothetical protein n=1 Tax=Roseomonas sp. USHLN139 TaxID=3081298 RepID=UPI003B0273B1
MPPKLRTGWPARLDACLPYVLGSLMFIAFLISGIPADELAAAFLWLSLMILTAIMFLGVPYGVCLGLLFVGLRRLLPTGMALSVALTLSAVATYRMGSVPLNNDKASAFLIGLTALSQLPCLLLLHMVNQVWPPANRKSS